MMMSFNFIDIAMSDSYPSTDMIFKKILRVHTYSFYLIKEQFSRTFGTNQVCITNLYLISLGILTYSDMAPKFE